MAWRSWSASPAENPATSMAICMSCSWNQGSPCDLAGHRYHIGCGYVQGVCDDQVVEGPGLEARQRGHLGPALDLEHPDRVGLAQHVVDGVLLGDLGQIDLHPVGLGDEVDGVVQGAEHAQAEQV